MKNKRLLYVLIPLAGIVWGIIIYRLMQTLEAPKEASYKNNIANIAKENTQSVPDTFKLLLKYQDPFLAERKRTIELRQTEVTTFLINSPIARNPAQTIASPMSKPLVTTTEWPKIEFNGLIENKAKKERIAMLHIGGITHLVYEGQTADQVKLIKLHSDSIQVEYGKQKKFYRRS